MRSRRRQQRRRAGAGILVLASVAMVTVATTGIPFLSSGATAETTNFQSGSPTIQITPVDSLLQPLLDLLEPPAAPEAEPATPQDMSTPAPEAAPTPTASPLPGGLAGSVVQAMNADRAANGLAPLSWNGQLGAIAQNWAQWMAENNSMTHQDLNAVAARTGFSKVGENLLYGPVSLTAGEMESLWMNSPPHRANILDPSFSVAGVGLAVGPDGLLWAAVDFGG